MPLQIDFYPGFKLLHIEDFYFDVLLECFVLGSLGA